MNDQLLSMKIYKKFALLMLIITVVGLLVTMLRYYDIIVLPITSPAIFSIVILTDSILICCVAGTLLTNLSSKLPEYQEEEYRFKEGKAYYDDGEWEEALKVFNEILDPDMDHRRALYYAARCYQQLSQWEDMKRYCKRYLELVPNDKEVWELLAEAHKRLFEYEEADSALQHAKEL